MFQPSNTLEQVLDGTTKLLGTATAAVNMETRKGCVSSEEESEGEGEESEGEEEFDDYYGDEDFDQQDEAPEKERYAL